MVKFSVRYNGKLLGWEEGANERAALNKLMERNPHHLPEKFELTPVRD